MLFVRVRVHHVDRFPPYGPMLICSNHQSNLDPVVMGVICPFPINYLAKESLFDFAPLGWFLSWNDCLPIEREAGAIGGIKRTLKRLKQGEPVLMFPEGSRSPDGELQPIKSGFCMMARRMKVPVVPVAIAGAWEAYPRQAKFPRLGNVQVVVGDPINFAQYESLDDESFSARVEDRISELLDEARRKRVSSLNVK